MPHKDEIRTRLLAMLEDIAAQDALGKDSARIVTLDQQSVGRLSRMDALQNQAMAQATERRRHATRQRILAALARLDADDYGYCAECGEEIPPARLEFDPAVPRCIACASP